MRSYRLTPLVCIDPPRRPPLVAMADDNRRALDRIAALIVAPLRRILNLIGR